MFWEAYKFSVKKSFHEIFFECEIFFEIVFFTTFSNDKFILFFKERDKYCTSWRDYSRHLNTFNYLNISSKLVRCIREKSFGKNYCRISFFRTRLIYFTTHLCSLNVLVLDRWITSCSRLFRKISISFSRGGRWVPFSDSGLEFRH